MPGSPTDHSYEDGVREGRLLAIEHMQERQNQRLDRHESRITAQERITYALLGAIALIEILPAVQKAVGS